MCEVVSLPLYAYNKVPDHLTSINWIPNCVLISVLAAGEATRAHTTHQPARLSRDERALGLIRAPGRTLTKGPNPNLKGTECFA